MADHPARRLVQRYSRVSREAAHRQHVDEMLSGRLEELSERLSDLAERLRHTTEAMEHHHHDVDVRHGRLMAHVDRRLDDERERNEIVVDEATRRAEAADGRLAAELQHLGERIAELERRLPADR